MSESYIINGLDVVLEPVFPARAAVDSLVARVRVDLSLDVAPARVALDFRCLLQQGHKLRLELDKQKQGRMYWGILHQHHGICVLARYWLPISLVHDFVGKSGKHTQKCVGFMLGFKISDK